VAEDNKVEEKPATQAPTAQAPEKKSGGNKTLTVVIIVVAILGVLGVAGYFGVRYLLNRTGEEITEGILESTTDGDVDLDYNEDGGTVTTEDGTTSVGSSAEWPSDIPSSVPKYTEGNITYSSTTTDGWSMMYEEIGSTSLASYKSSLEDKGWTIISSTDATSGNSIQAENGTYDLYIIAFEEGETATLTVTKKSDY